MNNLKRDILEELIKEKGYLEIDNARLAQNPIVGYYEMVNTLKDNIKNIAIINGSIGLIEVYFPEQKVENTPQPMQEESVQAPVVEEQMVVNEPEEIELPVEENSVDGDNSPFPKIN